MAAGISVLLAMGAGFSRSLGSAVLYLILSPLIFLVYIVLIRVALELAIVIFNIADHTRQIMEKLQQERLESGA